MIPVSGSASLRFGRDPFSQAPAWLFGVTLLLNAVFPAVAVDIDSAVRSIDVAYHSDKQFFLYESREFHADSFEVGLRVGYTWNECKYGIALFGRNLTDEVIVQNGIDFNNLTGMTNEPRLMGVELSLRY